MQQKTIIFISIITVLVIVLALTVSFMPTFIQESIIPFLKGLMFVIWTTVAFALMFAGPFFIGKYAKKLIRYLDTFDEHHKFVPYQWVLLAFVGALVTGAFWLWLPEVFMVRDGWIYNNIVDDVPFTYEVAHTGWAVYSFLLYAISFAIN